MSEVLIITGAYGVGKSEFASQLALLKAPCALADLDVINPYFRPREQALWLKSKGVDVLGSILPNHINQDFPAMSGNLRGAISQNIPLIIDCAGSENGLKPLASFEDVLQNAQVWLVVNANRPESFFDQIKPMIELFESRSHLRISGFVHNTHLLDQTDPSMILKAQAELEVISKALNVPIVYTMINEKYKSSLPIHNPLVCFDHLILRSDWMKGETL
ncbi:MAG: hypothetical protein HGB31_03330 [Erysipelotrichaceae bacterium]|nr:hypothetical protein [Erysipelotrichaceae bacterium]